jgi:hypothetical protein
MKVTAAEQIITLPNKVQGLFCEETGLPEAYLQETRG